MQNKGFVKVFAVLLTLVCLFYLSFSFVTQHYNSKAAEYAGGDPAKESAYLDSLSTQKVWLGYTLKQCREMEISLGLDLKGGMNVVLELNVADVIRSLSNNNQDENFNKALDLAYAHQATSQKDFIDLFAEEYKKLDSGARLSAIFSTFELKDKITPQSSDAQVVSVLKQELQSAIDNSFNVLRTRIDRFGVVSPNIQRLETAGRILVELPGVKEPERVRKLCTKLNKNAVSYLAKAAEANWGEFIQISTDYVFDGTKHLPYNEGDVPCPNSVYGKTKLAGETNALEYCKKTMIIRTAWLYSTFGNNFVKTMLRLGKEKETLGVVFDQIGTPTYARDLARAIFTAIYKGVVPGVYHFSDEGVCSWYDFTKAIHRIAGITTCKVSPLHTNEYPAKAPRPHYSVLDKTKIKTTYNIEIPHWEESLEACIKELNA